MPRIEVRIMELEEREQFTLSGGTKQDRARALFIALLPDDGTCYTAAEVVKYSLGRKEDHDHYVAHYKALDSLARVHGIGDGKIPGPDNVDPATNKRLPGKKRGTLQPCRWNRSSWLNIVSDEIYAWLRELNQKLKELAKDQPAGTRLFCELDRFEISFEYSKATPQRQDASAKNMQKRNKLSIGPIIGLVAAGLFFILTFLMRHPTKGEFAPTPKHRPSERELVLDYREYLQASREIFSAFSTPLPISERVATWKADNTATFLASQPPGSFLAGREPSPQLPLSSRGS